MRRNEMLEAVLPVSLVLGVTAVGLIALTLCGIVAGKIKV
jgi:hypothetical protein